MGLHEVRFTVQGNYTNYQLQQLIAERIFSMQGHQNQLYRVRNVRLLRPGSWEVTLCVPGHSVPLPDEDELTPLDALTLYEGPED